MPYVCRDWTPSRWDLEPCNTFYREITAYDIVDRDDDYVERSDREGNEGSVAECTQHDTNIDWHDYDDAVSLYRQMAAEENYGFCEDDFQATREGHDYACEACGQTWLPGEDEAEEDNVTETDEDEDDPAPGTARLVTVGRLVNIPGRGTVRIPAAATHAGL